MIEPPPDDYDGLICLGCGYPLKGLLQNNCPECGRKFNPADPNTFLIAAERRFVTKREIAGVVLMLVGFVLYASVCILGPYGLWIALAVQFAAVVCLYGNSGKT